MIYLGNKEVKEFLFMHLPNNVLFTGATALFDKKIFLKCPDSKLHGFIPVGEDPSEDPEEVPISLDDGDDGPDRTAPNPSIPRRDKDDDHNGDVNPPPPDVPDNSDDSSHAPIEPPLHCSGRTQIIPSRPNNVYGDRTPTNILQDIECQTFCKKAVERSSRTPLQPPISLPHPISSN